MLDGIQERIHDDDDMMKVYKTIVCSFILHIICIDSVDTFDISILQNVDEERQDEEGVEAADKGCEDSEDMRTCMPKVVLSRRGFQ